MPKNRKRRKSAAENTDPRKALLVRAAKGSAFTVVIFFGLIFLLALAVVQFNISDSMQNIALFFSATLASFLGSFIAMRKTHEKGLVSGLLMSIPAIAVVSLVLLAVLHTLGAKTLLMSAMMLVGGILGGIAAVNK